MNHQKINPGVSVIFVVLAIMLVISCSSTANAQAQNQYDKSTPPQFAAGVSPLGSYTSADMGTVNLSNGALNLKLAMGSIGGRGGIALPITLNWSSKIWSASIDYDMERGGRGGGEPSMVPLAYAEYDAASNYMEYNQRIEAGWSIGSLPFLSQRLLRINYTNIQPRGPCYDFNVPKLTLMMPDKGEIEFRDDNYDGAPLHTDCSGWITGLSRGHRWHATDGSGMIYINDVDNGAAQRFADLSGVVITADGTRLTMGAGGGCSRITDRNGNQISITENGIVDQLGRTTSIQQNVPDPENPSETLAVLVTIKGYGGTPRYYKVRSGTMNEHYRGDLIPNLPVVTGSYDPMSWGYDDWWPATATRLFPLSYGLFAQRIDDRPVIYELELPDHRSVHFSYNKFGEVAEVLMPTGGKVWYDYGSSLSLPSGNSPVFETTGTYHTTVPQVDRALKQRRTFPDGSTLEGTWNYSYGGSSTTVTATDPNGTVMLNESHFFLPAGRYTDYPNGTGGGHDGTFYNLWSTGVEYRTEIRNAAGDAVISASEQDWTQRAPVAWSTYPQEQPANDNRVNESRKILDDGSTAKIHTYYQPGVRYNNPVDVQEFDFDQTMKRHTTTTYADAGNLINGFDYTSDSIHLVSLPLVTTIYDGNDNMAAQTVNEYDYYADDGNHYYLLDYGSVTQHDSNYSASYSTRGNLTRSGQWFNLTNSFIYSYIRYDDLGNVVSGKDPNGNISSVSFADDFGNGAVPGAGAAGTYGATYALPTLITSPPPRPGEPVQTARTQYDFSTGLVTGFKDRNGVITQTIYNDPFNRPTFIKAALGLSGVESHAAMYYAPAMVFGISLTNNDVLSARDQTSLDDLNLRSWTHTDGFGRTIEAWSRDPQGDDKVCTIYDALGRPYKQSTPFRPAYQSAVYSTTGFDLAGRVSSVTTPDSAVVNTSYSGNTVTVTDQHDSNSLGHSRRSVNDGLGRLIQVYEDPFNVNYLTSYSYDTLDNLIGVSQIDPNTGTNQTRSFVYDSMKRLRSATNPESGAICYGTTLNGQCLPDGYDNNGNLIFKTDARGVRTTYGYDTLSRPTSRSYSDGTTPNVAYLYDSQGLPSGAPSYTHGSTTGRLIATTYGGGSAGDYYGYDPTGRSNVKVQQTGGVNYLVSAIYNLAGAMTSETYPSLRTVSYNYDFAGRANSVTGTLGDNLSRTYSDTITYSPFGGLAQERFGTTTAIYNKLFYNVRGQLAEIREGLTPNDTSWRRGAIINFYSTCWGMCGGENSTTPMPDNNGNLKTQQVFVPLVDDGTYEQHYTMLSQSYDYDSLNRLQSAQEGSWKQTYAYDRFGNRTINSNPGATYGGVNNLGFEVETGANRLYSPGDLAKPDSQRLIRYDEAGNQKKDYYTDTANATVYDRTYDAENRITQSIATYSAPAGNQTSNYGYDGDGRRVKRTIGTVETWQVYGIGGELVAEYAANAPNTTPQKEYAYRNGQLLITATVTAGGWGAPPTFDDNPLNPHFSGETNIRAAHITQLRAAIDALRGHLNLAPYSWQYSATTNDLISANPIIEMRTALDQALGAPSGGYSPGLAVGQPILAIHIQELRNRVLGSWNSSSGGVDFRWLVVDQLGTPRISFDLSGNFAGVSRHDYLPFGEEMPAALRSSVPGYGVSDGARQKFTQKERDNETGLDYFGARYYGSTQGRFTSADPLMSSGTIYDPQSWNRYSYTGNNPLRFIDPTGMWDWDASAGGSDTDAQLEAKRDNKSLKKKERNAAKDALKYRKRFRDALSGATALAQSGKLNSSQQGEVSRAVKSYGTEGDGNKVIVGFGRQGTGVGASTDGTAADDSIVVTFGRGAKGFNLIADVAHEGSHVLDNQSFNLLHSNGGMYFDGRNGDISQYETERRAYEVTSLVAQAAGKGSYLNDSPSYEVWSKGWKAAERETKRARGIDRVISTHYEVSPTNPGWTFGQIKNHVP